MKTRIEVPHMPQTNVSASFAIKSSADKVIYPVDQINYKIDGVDLLWLNVSNSEEALNYYKNNFPFLTDEVCKHLAKYDLLKKINIALQI